MKKVILCGYNLVGCEVLKILHDKNYELYVFTHDSPYFIPDLKSYCEELKIPYTTDKISIKNLPFKPDIICSLYYRYIIDKEIIDLCEGKIFNLHPSLLPQYRGCSSITWAIINGEKYTGFTYHYINQDIDKGKIILKKKIEINSFDTQGTLYSKVMIEAVDYFMEAFNFVIDGKKGKKQSKGGKYYNREVPLGGKISGNWDIETTEKFIKAFIHPPYPVATYKNKPIEDLQSYLKLKNDE
tara:strand:+ start:1236 stop:1958 length:723 start_codon:yes stop_codon:yes gene_type:complete